MVGGPAAPPPELRQIRGRQEATPGNSTGTEWNQSGERQSHSATPPISRPHLEEFKRGEKEGRGGSAPAVHYHGQTLLFSCWPVEDGEGGVKRHRAELLGERLR